MCLLKLESFKYPSNRFRKIFSRAIIFISIPNHMRKGKLTRGVFRTLLNICDGVFQKKWGTAKSCLTLNVPIPDKVKQLS